MPEVGELAAPFTVNSAAGGKYSFPRDVHSPFLLLAIYRKNACKPCRAQLAYLAENYRALKARGIEVVVLSYPPVEEGAQVRAELHLPYLLLSDPKAQVLEKLGAVNAGKFHATGELHSGLIFPTLYLLDRSGRICAKLRTKKTATLDEFHSFLSDFGEVKI